MDRCTTLASTHYISVTDGQNTGSMYHACIQCKNHINNCTENALTKQHRNITRGQSNFTKSASRGCHETVSRLVLYCSWVVTGYLYILSNFVVYRTPHLIGPFECEVSAWRRVIGQAPLCGRGAFFPARVPACRESASQCL